MKTCVRLADQQEHPVAAIQKYSFLFEVGKLPKNPPVFPPPALPAGTVGQKTDSLPATSPRTVLSGAVPAALSVEVIGVADKSPRRGVRQSVPTTFPGRPAHWHVRRSVAVYGEAKGSFPLVPFLWCVLRRCC